MQQRQDKPNRNLVSQQSSDPKLRYVTQKTRLAQLESVQIILEQSNFRDLEAILRGEINSREKESRAINHTDGADRFAAFKEQAVFNAGYMQGVEFVLNIAKVNTAEIIATKKTIADLEKQINAKKRGGDDADS